MKYLLYVAVIGYIIFSALWFLRGIMEGDWWSFREGFTILGALLSGFLL